MTRKKVSNEDSTQNFDDNIPDLTDGEKVIITDQRTIEKKTVPAANQTPRDFVNFDNQIYDDEDDAPPEYSQNSIAHLIDNGDDSLENQFCTVMIRREPDSLTDNFLKPQQSRLSLQPLRNVELTADRSDIEELVRNLHGGGHYYFQIQYNGALSASWKQSLADSPEALAKAAADKVAIETAKHPQTPPQTALPPSANPFAQFFEVLKQQKEMKELLFGEELKELEELRRRDNNRQTPTAAPENEKLALLQYAEKMNNAELQNKLLGYVFGESESGGLLDTAKYVLDNQDKLASLATTVIGTIFGAMPTGAAAPTTQDIARMLKGKTPPAAPPTPPQTAKPTSTQSNFARKKKAGKENV